MPALVAGRETTISVLEYNTHLFGRLGRMVNQFYQDDLRAEKIGEALLATDAGLTALLEVWDDRLARLIIEITAGIYPFHFRPRDKNLFGIGSGLLLLSKYEILDPQFQRFKRLLGADFFSSKGFGAATIDLDSLSLELFFAHNQASSGGFLNQAARLANLRQLNIAIGAYRAGHPQNPVLALGDFNVAGEEIDVPTAEYQSMAKYFNDNDLSDLYRRVNALQNPGFTYDGVENTLVKVFDPKFSAARKRQRLDYIFGSSDIAALDIAAQPARNPARFKADYRYDQGSADLSDHFPLLLEFTIQRNNYQ
ncbi:hypothetical protein A2625_03025 [candidate division WOR-1 bacterium RIFCSPHIGHO2_01_FULL_53_15]|uniref:Endonuclease/exonuclease/phosphatase domain-containing protein n=1 Tax=candidate division WOR-1 bacterium RIFCSPHIGHO2_01_FULL_53_15 TaxID=1802564 RepID=A0A1F4Q364_UNCSA|nr:MAG: hypothetical protein A2625_03025 [candidate division WOR-1 bacterium RIFCSPHIGHO2_01_FULL_53_15]OGC10397.1 MAG: hypothetical protein A3D23_07710 [candidate division WOR-1 bacterium RIFCSPHIGHO2_02_FULL_53_26]